MGEVNTGYHRPDFVANAVPAKTIGTYITVTALFQASLPVFKLGWMRRRTFIVAVVVRWKVVRMVAILMKIGFIVIRIFRFACAAPFFTII